MYNCWCHCVWFTCKALSQTCLINIDGENVKLRVSMANAEFEMDRKKGSCTFAVD